VLVSEAIRKILVRSMVKRSEKLHSFDVLQPVRLIPDGGSEEPRLDAQLKRLLSATLLIQLCSDGAGCDIGLAVHAFLLALGPSQPRNRVPLVDLLVHHPVAEAPHRSDRVGRHDNHLGGLGGVERERPNVLLKVESSSVKVGPRSGFLRSTPSREEGTKGAMSEKLTISVSQTEVDPDGANKFVGWKGSQFFSAKAGLVGKKSSPKVGKEHASDESNASNLVGEQFGTVMRYDRDTVVTHLDSQAEALHHIISSSASSMVISLRAGSL